MAHNLPTQDQTEQPEAIRIGVIFYPNEQPMLKAVAKRIGTQSMAQAVRFIVTNWADISGYNKVPQSEEAQA